MPDDIDRIKAMFGDDDDDEGDGDKEPVEPSPLVNDAPRPVKLYQDIGGVTFRPMPTTQVEDLPNSSPVQWKAFEEQFHFKPYDSPTEEYIQSQFVLNQQTLTYRWQGYGPDIDKEIFMIFCTDEIRMKRILAQTVKRRQSGLPDPTNAEDVAANNAYQAQICLNQIDYLNYQLENNVEVTTEQYFRIKEGGTFYVESLRPLSASSRRGINKNLMQFMEQYRILSGQASKTMVNKVEHTWSTTAMLDAALQKNDYRTPEGYTMDDLKRMANGEALPAPQVVDFVEGSVEEPAPIPREEKES